MITAPIIQPSKANCRGVFFSGWQSAKGSRHTRTHTHTHTHTHTPLEGFKSSNNIEIHEAIAKNIKARKVRTPKKQGCVFFSGLPKAAGTLIRHAELINTSTCDSMPAGDHRPQTALFLDRIHGPRTAPCAVDRGQHRGNVSRP